MPETSRIDHAVLGRRSSREPCYRRFAVAQTFDEIVGQDAVVRTLRNAVRLGRLAHGFLFVGPRGTGKTSMARILAKAVNCTDLRDGEPCDRCPSCESIREGRALDVVELDAASNNKVDDMRELSRASTRPPRTSGARCSSSTRSSASRRAGTSSSRRSRSRRTTSCSSSARPIRARSAGRGVAPPALHVPAPDDRRDRGQARAHPRGRGATAEPDAIALVARRAGGGMRDAESMLDQILVARTIRSRPRPSRDLLGLAGEASVDAFIEALVVGDMLAGIAVLDTLEAQGRDLLGFGDQVVSRLREQLVARLAGTSPTERAKARPLAAAARRLTGIDASRAGLGGYRWQLELCLLAAATEERPAAVPSREPVTDRSASSPLRTEPPPSPDLAPAPELAVSPRRSRRRPRAGRRSPRRQRVADPSVAPSSPAAATPRPAPSRARLQQASSSTSCAASGPRSSPPSAPTPPIARSSRSRRPVQVRDGRPLAPGLPRGPGVPTGHPRTQAPRHRGRHRLVLGRAVGVRCVVTNLELVAAPDSSDDLVAQARRIFEGELVGVEDIGPGRRRPVGINNFARMAQQMQADMARVEQELRDLTVEGSAGRRRRQGGRHGQAGDGLDHISPERRRPRGRRDAPGPHRRRDR